MTSVGQREMLNQRWVIQYARGGISDVYSGDSKDREGKLNIEQGRLTGWLGGTKREDAT